MICHPYKRQFLYESHSGCITVPTVCVRSASAQHSLFGVAEGIVYKAIYTGLGQPRDTLCSEPLAYYAQEFHPYLFQIFAQLIELRSRPLPEVYLTQIFPLLLRAVFWERLGNVPALTRLLEAFLDKASSEIVQRGHLQVCCLSHLHFAAKAPAILSRV